MLRTAIIRTARPAARRVAPLMSVRYSSGEGATGSGFSRPGGMASGDSFTRREKAAEDLYVREMEKEKLRALKAKLQKQREHLDELDKHIDELTREQGGEKN